MQARYDTLCLSPAYVFRLESIALSPLMHIRHVSGAYFDLDDSATPRMVPFAELYNHALERTEDPETRPFAAFDFVPSGVSDTPGQSPVFFIRHAATGSIISSKKASLVTKQPPFFAADVWRVIPLPEAAVEHLGSAMISLCLLNSRACHIILQNHSLPPGVELPQLAGLPVEAPGETPQSPSASVISAAPPSSPLFRAVQSCEPHMSPVLVVFHRHGEAKAPLASSPLSVSCRSAELGDVSLRSSPLRDRRLTRPLLLRFPESPDSVAWSIASEEFVDATSAGIVAPSLE